MLSISLGKPDYHMIKKQYWVYILECSNGSYYTGYTSNLKQHFESHLNGSSRCKYTRSFLPIRIAQSWSFDKDKSKAMKIEAKIKSLPKIEKKKLIDDPTSIAKIE